MYCMNTQMELFLMFLSFFIETGMKLEAPGTLDTKGEIVNS